MHLKSSKLISLIFVLAMALLIATGSEAAPKKDRQKVIDFEDEVVEGMNKRPLDSVSQLSEKDRKKKKPHLYRKRSGFRTETAETLRTITYSH